MITSGDHRVAHPRRRHGPVAGWALCFYEHQLHCLPRSELDSTSGYSVAMSEPKVDVRALAKLARLEVSDEELLKLEREIPSILAFVETIQKADVEMRPSTGSASSPPASSGLHNVMRDDGEPHESGIYTEALLAQAPARKGNRWAVKQVISRGK